MIVTDFPRIDSRGKPSKPGYYMDGYLKQNLDPIPAFLKKKWDVVGIVSGHGKVGVGKSTMAGSVGYYIAWILAGGEVVCNEQNQVVEIIPPKDEVRFSLNNVVFSPEDLMKKAETLPKNSVIIYDEGRSGLDSASAMTAINKTMGEFFQRCRVYHHVIIIVLPNFFKLHEDYAVARSQFLIDTFADKDFNRGHFSFYNELQKEKLFFFGKRLIGITAKYGAAHRNFYGRFTAWVPWNEGEYDNAKAMALAKTSHTTTQVRLKKQRDASFLLLKNHAQMNFNDIAIAMMAHTGEKITPGTVENAIVRAGKEINR